MIRGIIEPGGGILKIPGCDIVVRCGQCKHWQPSRVEGEGSCAKISGTSALPRVEGDAYNTRDAALITPPDFWCKLAEIKRTKGRAKK